MADTTEAAQEPRNERATIALTATEKRALRFVADAYATTEAEILRTRAQLEGIVAEYEDMRRRLHPVGSGANSSEG